MFWKKSKKRGRYKKVSSEFKVNEILNKALANDLKTHPSLAIHFARQRFFKGMDMPEDNEGDQSTGDPNVDSVLKWAHGVQKIKEQFGGGGELFAENTIQTLIKNAPLLMKAVPSLMDALSQLKIVQGSKPSELVQREMGIRTLPQGEQPPPRALPEGKEPAEEQPKPEAITPKPGATTQEQPTPEPQEAPDDEVKEQRLVASIDQLAAMQPEQAAQLVFSFKEDGDICQTIYEHVVDSGYSFDDLLAKIDELEENTAYAYLKESLSKLNTANLCIFYDDLRNIAQKEIGLDESDTKETNSSELP